MAGQPTSAGLPAALAATRQALVVILTCHASYFILPCFLPAFFLLTSHEAIPAHLWELFSRLFLLAWRLTHPMLFRRVGFLRHCTGLNLEIST